MPKTETPKLRPVKDAQTATAPPWSAAAPPSHIGGRSEQQDARHIFFNADKGTMLIVVCDGVGGSRSGGEAAAQVIKTADQLWAERGGILQNPQRDLLAMSRTAHERICELASAGEKRAPASTLVALYLTPDAAHWVHSGDSRLYLFREGAFVSRTRDHSVVQILLDQGEITEAEMGEHPDQGRLLQSLGTKDYREPTYGSAQTTPADAFILCTDGFWERTSLRAMAEVVTGERRGLEARLSQALKNAVSANGREGDNVTAAAVVPTSGVQAAPFALKRWLPLSLICAGLLIAAGVIYTTRDKGGEGAANKPTSGQVNGPSDPNAPLIPTGGLGATVLGTMGDDPLEKELASAFSALNIKFHPVRTESGALFYMAETELTLAQWNKKGKQTEEEAETGGKKMDVDVNKPKSQVSPLEVTEWIAKLNAEKKIRGGAWRLRLPTAEEWIAAASGPNRDYHYVWGNQTSRPAGFGNWTPDTSSPLLPVSSTNDELEGWLFRDFLGNVSEIVVLPSDQGAGGGSGSAAAAGKFARFGTSNKTPKDKTNQNEELAVLRKGKEKNWSDWQITPETKQDDIGFRLVLAPHEAVPAKVGQTPSASAPGATPAPGEKNVAEGTKDANEAMPARPAEKTVMKDPGDTNKPNPTAPEAKPVAEGKGEPDKPTAAAPGEKTDVKSKKDEPKPATTPATDQKGGEDATKGKDQQSSPPTASSEDPCEYKPE